MDPPSLLGPRPFPAEHGSLRVAPIFPRNPHAIYAFLHIMADGSRECRNALLGHLRSFKNRWESGIKMLNANPGMYLRANTDSPESFSIVLHRDIFAAFVLDHFAHGCLNLREALIAHRFELCLRILDAANFYTPPASSESTAPDTVPSTGIGEVQIQRLNSLYFPQDDRQEHVKNISIGG